MDSHPARADRRLHRAPHAVLVCLIAFALAFSGFAPASAQDAGTDPAVSLDALKVERKIEPVGIDLAAPRFSWLNTSAKRDVRQTSYRIRVRDAEDVVWDSQVVASDKSFDVEYDGPALKPATRYDWTVDVETSAGNATASSSFKTGLMAEADWADSAWIGAASTTDDALAVWDNYTAEFDFTIDAFSFGAFVRAPSTSNGLMWQVSVADGTPRLRPHSKVSGNFALLGNIDVSAAATVDQLTKQSNKLAVTVSPGSNESSVNVVTRLNGVEVDSRQIANAGTFQRGFVGLRSNTNSGQNERSTLHALKVTRAGGDVLANYDFSDGENPFSAGTISGGSLKITTPVETILAPPPAAAPLMRKEFTVDGDVRSATYYVAAGGYADVSLNGAPISDELLSPGFTDYDDTVQYAATDVTDQLVAGKNALGMELGRGFFAMTGGNVWNWESPPWHAEPRARGVLAIEYADGSTQRVITDDSWKYTAGPTQLDDLYAGEIYKAAAEVPGWNKVGFDADSWRTAKTVTGPKGELVNQRQQPIRITESLPAVDVKEPADGVYVVKFPRVIAGVVEYSVKGPAGTRIRAAHGEKLRANGRVNMDNNGGFQNGFQTDQFILAGTGETEKWTPKFSYKGFQYIEVTGWPGDEAPPLSAFTAKLLHTDADRTGTFESSSSTMNETHEAVVNTLYNNIHHIPTDTPMFEKNGWTGDAAVGAEMFMMNLDVHELFAKWMRDVDETREGNGAPMVIAPSSGNWGVWGPSQPWHAAYVLTPWWLFQYGGDDKVMTELYDGMKKYVDMEFGRRRADGTVISNRLGDWVSPTASPGGGHAPDEDNRVSGTAYLFTMLESMERTARHLGKTADADEFAQRAKTVKTDFNKAYFESSKDRYRGEGADGNRYRQTHNVLALAFGLTPDDATAQRVADRLAVDVAERGYHLDTGTLGTKFLLPVLTKYGHSDAAFKLATQTTYPSWGYKLENGATTMWEHWKLESRSLGHYFLGTVDDWFYRDVAGIRPSDDKGYREVTIAPQVTKEMTWAKATTQSPFGPVTSDWRRSGRSVRLNASVPVGATAKVVLPGEAGSTVLEAGQPAVDAAGVRDAVYANGNWTLTVGSGNYDFRVLPVADLERDVEVSISADSDQLHRGDSATGEITVSNTSPVDISDVNVKVSGKSLTFDDDSLAVGDLAGDKDKAVKVQGDVALDAPMGALDVDVVTTFTAAGQPYSVTKTLPWITVTSGATLDQVQIGKLDEADGAKTADVTAVVNNSSALPLKGKLTVRRAGWTTTSDVVTVPARGSAPVTAKLTARGHVVMPSMSIDLAFVDGEVELAAGTGAVATSLTLPPASFVDHVDFGNTTSEAAHGILASSSSGINNEAGFSRRYAHSQYPGSWFSAELDVPKGRPFAVRLRETFDGAKTKEFNLYADDVFVGRYLVPRTAGGNGTIAHQLIVDAPDVFAVTADGKARLKFEFPTNAQAGNFDPSIADAWVLEVPSAEGPKVTAAISKSGEDGWHGAGAELTLASQTGASIRYRIGAGAWTDYSAPVELAEGTSTLELQATASDGALGFVQTTTVKVDGTKPVAGASIDEDRQVTITAEDVLSGVSSVEYKLGDGDWRAVEGPIVLDQEAHVVTYRATDRAGNVSEVGELKVPGGPLDSVVAAEVSNVGKDGWHGAGAKVTLTASDDDVSVRYRIDGGQWIDYVAPFAPDEGLARVEFQTIRGERLGVVGSIAIKVDATVPTVKATAGADRKVTIVANDELSGVDLTEYRLDGGNWVKYTAPFGLNDKAHSIEYRSVDVAGNATDAKVLGVAAAPILKATKSPAVSGTTRVGHVATAQNGSWNASGLTYRYRWLRDGRTIAGVAGKSYRLQPADAGARVSVQVTATKVGHVSGTATSARTAKVRSAVSKTSVKLNRKSLKKGQKLSLTVSVKASGVTPTGRVDVYYRGKKVRTLTLKKGKASSTFRPTAKGKHTLKVVYRGAKGIDGSKKSVSIRLR